MFGYIILRDIPKYEAQLDLSLYEIRGGFRGFAQVEPGIHYINVSLGDSMVEGFWCFVRRNDAVIKIFDYDTHKFTDCDLESEQTYKEMAVNGVMNRALIPVMQKNSQMALLWKNLTKYLQPSTFPPKIYHENPMSPPQNMTSEKVTHWYSINFKSRFEQAFHETHQDDEGSFLEELQWVFISSLLKAEENEARERWHYLLQAIYHAGESAIEQSPELFVKLTSLIRFQIECINSNDLTSLSTLTCGLKYLIEDMKDVGISNLDQSANSLKGYLLSRGIII